MGDIAEGLVDGTYDSVTGEYLGEGWGCPRSEHTKFVQKNSVYSNKEKTNGLKKFLTKNDINKTDQFDYCIRFLKHRKHDIDFENKSWNDISETISKDWNYFSNYVYHNK